MNFHGIGWMKNLSLKTKLCALTVLLIGVVMIFVGYVVIAQQRKTLLLQMEGTGIFLVKNLAKNVVGPLLGDDKLSLNNLITSLESRDKSPDNPARLSPEEYQNFASKFLLEAEQKATLLDKFIQKKEGNFFIDLTAISRDDLRAVAAKVFGGLINIVIKFETQEQYDAFFKQSSWTKGILEPIIVTNGTKVQLVSPIPENQKNVLTEKLTDILSNQLLSYVRNRLIGYAIIVDKDEIIRAHPDFDNYVGKKYIWQPGTVPLNEGKEDIKIQHLSFQGERHYDFAAPVVVRDQNRGTAYVGRVHIGLREEYIEKNLAAAKRNILYMTVIAVILGSAGAYVLAALFIKPIKELVRDAEILGGGNLDYQIHASSHDEVGVLASTLDLTRIKLKDAQEQLVVNERLARELEIAKEIQMALLPKEMPVLEHIEIGALYRAAAQVGGDLYDFFWVSSNELGIVVADVSGKGIPGSLVMTMTKAVIRAKAVESDLKSSSSSEALGRDPASVLRKTNQIIAQDIKKGMFITVNYGILNVDTWQFHFVSAGHNNTLVYNSRSEDLQEYNPKGIALGLDKGTLFNMTLQDQKVLLSSGDLLIQYTDGITEAMNAQRDEFGEDRLKDVIRKYAHHPVNDFLSLMDQEIRAFTGGFPQNDDITAVVIRIT